MCINNFIGYLTLSIIPNNNLSWCKNVPIINDVSGLKVTWVLSCVRAFSHNETLGFDITTPPQRGDRNASTPDLDFALVPNNR